MSTPSSPTLVSFYQWLTSSQPDSSPFELSALTTDLFSTAQLDTAKKEAQQLFIREQRVKKLQPQTPTASASTDQYFKDEADYLTLLTH